MQAPMTSGRTDLEKSVLEWLRTELEDPEITGSNNFLDIGGHSVIFSKLNKFLSDSFGVVLDQKKVYSDQLSEAVASSQPIGNA